MNWVQQQMGIWVAYLGKRVSGKMGVHGYLSSLRGELLQSLSVVVSICSSFLP